MSILSPTPRSTVRRSKHRARTDRADLYDVLDAALVCHLAVIVDGAPLVVPTCFGRDGDTLYLHGSSAAASLRTAAESPVCVAVTVLDGVVYARSVFHHSVNYRSAVMHAMARAVTDDEERLRGLRAFVEHVAPGAWAYARRPNAKELAKTAVLAIDLTEASVKVRTGPPVDEDEDVAADDRWAGVLPLRSEWGLPQPCPLLGGGKNGNSHDTPQHVTGRAQLGGLS